MADVPDNSQVIAANGMKPKRGVMDGEVIEMPVLTDQIAADQYARAARTTTKQPFRLGRIVAGRAGL